MLFPATQSGIARRRATAAQHLAIDRTRCDGHGVCRALLPDRISLDEWGFPILAGTDVADGERADVRRAVAACPALALHLTTDQLS